MAETNNKTANLKIEMKRGILYHSTWILGVRYEDNEEAIEEME
jgi:hypothetical protein